MSSILDLAALVDDNSNDSKSTLNANAPVFIPGGSSTPPMDSHAGAHDGSHSPTEQWFEGEHFLPASWMGQPQPHPHFYAAPQFYMPAQVLDYEDSLRDSLYVKPQKPKGNTAGRARTQSYAGALMQA